MQCFAFIFIPFVVAEAAAGVEEEQEHSLSIIYTGQFITVACNIL